MFCVFAPTHPSRPLAPLLGSRSRAGFSVDFESVASGNSKSTQSLLQNESKSTPYKERGGGSVVVGDEPGEVGL